MDISIADVQALALENFLLRRDLDQIRAELQRVTDELAARVTTDQASDKPEE